MKIHRPTALALGGFVLVIVALATWGHQLGMSEDALSWVQSAAALIGLAVMAALPKLLADKDGDGVPDILKPPAGPVALLLCAIAIPAATTGCGSAIGTQARIATAGLVTVDGIQRFADHEHETAIAACPPPGSETRIACIDAADSTWIPVGEGADGAGVALVTWIGTLEVARMAEGSVDDALALAMTRAVEAIRPAFVLALCRGADIPPWLLGAVGIDPETACQER